MSEAQELLSKLIGDNIAKTVQADVDLSAAGVGSGDLIRLVLLIENHYDVALSARDIDGMRTLGDIDAVIDRLRLSRSSAVRNGG